MPLSRFRKKVRPLAYAQLKPWLAGAAGRKLLDVELSQVQAVLPQMFGYRLLQVGSWGYGESLVESTPMLHHWVVGVRGGSRTADSDGQALPIKNESVDAVLLPHSLELVKSPHRLLREVDRVLTARGHVLLNGFNPVSLWGMRQWLPWGEGYLASGTHYYTVGRVCDWLELLDFEVMEIRRYGSSWSTGSDIEHRSGQWLRRLGSPFTQGYQIWARKRLMPMTPMREPLMRRSMVRPAVIPEARVSRVRYLQDDPRYRPSSHQTRSKPRD